MRKPVIAGNWKMYKTLSQAVDTALGLKPLVANSNHCDVVIAPVFTALKTVADRLEGSNIRVAGQDCSTETEEGAHTGEVLASMLKDVGARYVIVGHSERRQYYAETDVQVNRKTHAGIAAGLTVIMCVGESLEQREQGVALQREVVEAFVAACAGGDMASLVSLLDPDVVMRSDGGGKIPAVRDVQQGAEHVADHRHPADLRQCPRSRPVRHPRRSTRRSRSKVMAQPLRRMHASL